MNTYNATVKVSNGKSFAFVHTQVKADDSYKAKLLLQQQYGRDSVMSTPQLVRQQVRAKRTQRGDTQHLYKCDAQATSLVAACNVFK